MMMMMMEDLNLLALLIYCWKSAHARERKGA